MHCAVFFITTPTTSVSFKKSLQEPFIFPNQRPIIIPYHQFFRVNLSESHSHTSLTQKSPCVANNLHATPILRPFLAHTHTHTSTGSRPMLPSFSVFISCQRSFIGSRTKLKLFRTRAATTTSLKL